MNVIYRFFFLFLLWISFMLYAFIVILRSMQGKGDTFSPYQSILKHHALLEIIIIITYIAMYSRPMFKFTKLYK